MAWSLFYQPWTKDQPRKTLVYTVKFYPQLQIGDMWDNPSHTTQNFVTVGAKL